MNICLKAATDHAGRMVSRIYILAALAFSTVLLWAGMANFDNAIWEYSYYLSGKLLALWAVDTGGRWIKFLPYEHDTKLKVREVLRVLWLLFLIRILWELIAIFAGYDFMMSTWPVIIYLAVILCLIGYTTYMIRRYN